MAKMNKTPPHKHQTSSEAGKDSYFREMAMCEIREVSGEGNERKRILSFSSEQPYERWDGVEILDHAPDAVDLGRIGQIGCLLFNHDRDRVIGKICRVWLENSRAMAEVEFDGDEDSEVIFQKVKSGTLKGVSTGYKITRKEVLSPGQTSKDGRFTGPVYIARGWFPFEISIVSIPADMTVGVGRQMDQEADICQKAEISLEYLQRQIQINKNFQKERIKCH